MITKLVTPDITFSDAYRRRCHYKIKTKLKKVLRYY